MNKKFSQLRAKNDVTHAIRLKMHEEMNKKLVMTSYGRNKNLDGEIRNIAARILKTTRNRKLTILSYLRHILHNYAKHLQKKQHKNYYEKTN